MVGGIGQYGPGEYLNAQQRETCKPSSDCSTYGPLLALTARFHRKLQIIPNIPNRQVSEVDIYISEYIISTTILRTETLMIFAYLYVCPRGQCVRRLSEMCCACKKVSSAQ